MIAQDANGYAVPWSDHDAIIEAEAELNDPAAAETGDWPPDSWRYELGPGDPAAESIRDLRYSIETIGDDCPPLRCDHMLEQLSTIESALIAARNDPPGPEPASFEPAEANWASYVEWCQSLDDRWWFQNHERGPTREELELEARCLADLQDQRDREAMITDQDVAKVTNAAG
jgi:hypothetical protein